ncbi:MAG: GNAT family N-acetyltransferase [Algoriphagus sp.]|jgi:GNAT superfamily N-acetyltransferase|nr:GNAT family N-acetyltransferase [Algoriphagus sp.]MCE2779087.1 GNAT family N-acetyltransferase [Algoriphagus sp.]
MKNLIFQVENVITLIEFQIILEDSGLSKRRPMEDPQLLERMIKGANLIISARSEGQLVGLLRGLSDFCYRSFIADLAVARSFQRKGIGRQLIQVARNQAPEARLILFSAEDAAPFYKKLGFHLHERCYQLKAGEELL